MGFLVTLGLAFFLPSFSWGTSDEACPYRMGRPTRPEPTWVGVESAVAALRAMAELGQGEFGTADYEPPFSREDAVAHGETILPEGRTSSFTNVVGIPSAMGWLHSNGFQSLFPSGPDGVAMKLAELRDEGYLRLIVVRHPRNRHIARPCVLIQAFLEAEGRGKWVSLLYRFGN